jgi:hypothetical protein
VDPRYTLDPTFGREAGQNGRVDERARRIGENEALYRAVNEKIEDLSAAFGTITETMSVVCECGDASCAEQIEVSIADYERIRADATFFIIRPGHEIPDVEEVMERNDEFHVVRKAEGAAADLARELDTRR